MRGVVLVCSVAVLVSITGTAAAESESYGAVDHATVRVFSIGTVGVETVEKGGRSIQIANASAGHGTGFVVDLGLILTANHVVKDARHVVVRLPGTGGFFSARVVYSDPAQDIAVLAVQSDLTALTLSDNKVLPRVRESVFAVGYPLDPRRTQPQSARGIIAGFLDDGTVQLDMALNPGNSGGPLIGPNERVIGMVVARGDPKAGVQNIGFAVPVAKLNSAVAEAKRRVAAGMFSPLDAKSKLAAEVVDRLIQRGALDELGQDGSLGKTLRSADLDTQIRELIARVDDADLLVFIAATLWNAALLLDLGLRKIDDTTLVDAAAYSLAEQLRRASIDACRRAASLDNSVGQRSTFVHLATQYAAWAGGSAGASQQTWTPMPPPPQSSAGTRPQWRILATSDVRYNGVSGSVGLGGGLGAFALFGTDAKLVLGTALGRVSLDGPIAGDRFAHTFVSAEIGVAGSITPNWLVGTAYCPGYYWSTVEESAGQAGRAEGGIGFHFRGWIEYRLGTFVLGAGLRMLSGPTFWIEPLTLGVAL